MWVRLSLFPEGEVVSWPGKGLVIPAELLAAPSLKGGSPPER